METRYFKGCIVNDGDRSRIYVKEIKDMDEIILESTNIKGAEYAPIPAYNLCRRSHDQNFLVKAASSAKEFLFNIKLEAEAMVSDAITEKKLDKMAIEDGVNYDVDSFGRVFFSVQGDTYYLSSDRKSVLDEKGDIYEFYTDKKYIHFNPIDVNVGQFEPFFARTQDQEQFQKRDQLSMDYDNVIPFDDMPRKGR